MSNYERAMSAYVKALSEMRQESVEEIRRLMPDGVAYVILEVNDTPRLTLSAMVYEDGSETDGYEHEESGLYDQIDEVASCTDVTNWDDARSFLPRDEIGRFVIGREE